MTHFVPPSPPYAVRGAGAVVVDDGGNKLIDCNNNYTSLIHGHAHPQLVEVARETAGRGSAFGLPTESELDLAEILAERTGVPRWRFCNSGTEAVLMAVQAARVATRRETIIRFDGSYHGAYDDVVDGPVAALTSGRDARVVVLPQRDTDALVDAVDRLGERLAAVLIDPMPNRAGLVPVPAEFIRLARRLTMQVGAKLIIDEVITFRLEHGGLQRRLAVQADLTVVGKIIGGGFPAGGVGLTEELTTVFAPAKSGTLNWGGTFSANPVTMCVGAQALRMYTPSVIRKLNDTGDRLRHALRDAGVAANGQGSLIRLLLDDDVKQWWSLYQHGVLVGRNGLLALSTAMSDEQLDQVKTGVIEAMRGR